MRTGVPRWVNPIPCNQICVPFISRSGADDSNEMEPSVVIKGSVERGSFRVACSEKIRGPGGFHVLGYDEILVSVSDVIFDGPEFEAELG